MLVYLRKWAQDPVLLAKNIVVVLVTESLAELDPKLVRAARHARGRDPAPGRRRAAATTSRRRARRDLVRRALRAAAAARWPSSPPA